jgi:hypothetical protein
MTITLSITASMNRPNADTWFARRASMPSNQSVSAEAMNSQKAHVAAHGQSEYIRATTTNIIGTRETVSTLGRVNFTRQVQTTVRSLAISCCNRAAIGAKLPRHPAGR